MRGSRRYGTVVLMSQSALRDDDWHAAVRSIAPGRLVPIRIGTLVADDVPDVLRRPNWIEWNEEHPAATMGSVLAALLADPERRRMARELTNEAQAWVDAGRPPGLLISDYRRARQMSRVLGDLQSDPLAHPGDAVPAFVKTSLAVTRKGFRKQRSRWVWAALLLPIAVLLVAAVLEVIHGVSQSERETAAAGGPGTLSHFNQTSAASAAALLIVTHTPALENAARQRLFDSLWDPWDDAVIPLLGLSALIPYDGGTRALAVGAAGGGGRAVAIIGVPAGTVLWSSRLPSGFGAVDTVSVAPDATTAIVAGENRTIATVDLVDHRLTAERVPEDVARATALSRGRAMLSTADGAVGVLDPRTGSTGVLRRLGAVIALGSGDSGSGAALVNDGDGHVSVVDVASGRTLSSGSLPAAPTLAAISPDGRSALAAVDGEVWRIDRNGAEPTGIGLPPLTQALAWIAGNRVVVAGPNRGIRVYDGSDGAVLGTACSDVVGLSHADIDAGGDTAGCVGVEGALWPLPAAPLTTAPIGLSRTVDAHGRYADATASGIALTIHVHPPHTDQSGSFANLLGAPISAVSWTPDGVELVVGAENGQVAVVALNSLGSLVDQRWTVPDGSPIAAVGWSHGPVVETAANKAWAVAHCEICATENGALVEQQRRQTSCLSAGEIAPFDPSLWRPLGLHECPAPRRIPVH
jgi:hypothetical protein